MNAHFAEKRPMVMGIDWMITADHPLAARAGAAVLESGGNAVDAAVAANLVMTVVRPHMCGIGGDLFALIFMAGDNRFEALNASGRAPSGAAPAYFREKGMAEMPASGILTATVPGALAGWHDALQRFGTRSLDQLLGPAIDYAERGFPVNPELSHNIRERLPVLDQSKAAMDTFVPGGRVPGVGDRIVQPRLAASLRTIADKGPDAFYRGPLGTALLEHSAALGGLFSEQDLRDHASTWETPLQTDYRGYRLCTQPPNSQGIALLMQANILSNFDLFAFQPNQAELIHLMVESKKLAFADRDRYVCDPAFGPVPVERMLDQQLARAQADRISPDTAAVSVAPQSFTAGGDDTIFLSVVDARGNAVSLIQSIYEPFGSCVMVPETAMLLHNRGRGFSLDPDHPNGIAPGKRPYHTLHPAMILKDGRPYIVLGTPGADGQTQTNIQTAVAMLDFRATVQGAMEAPRWRSEPDGTLLVEGRFPGETIRGLEKRGHRVKVLPDYHEIMGSSQAIRVDRERGVLFGGACPRRNAYVIGK